MSSPEHYEAIPESATDRLFQWVSDEFGEVLSANLTESPINLNPVQAVVDMGKVIRSRVKNTVKGMSEALGIRDALSSVFA